MGEAEGLELADLAQDLLLAVGSGGPVGAELDVPDLGVLQEVSDADEGGAGGGAPGAQRPGVRRLSRPGDAIARWPGAAARLGA